MGSRGRCRGRGGRRPDRGRIPGGRGRGGRHYPASGITRKRQDSSFTTLTDGTVIEYHPSFKFADDVFAKFKPSDKQNLFDARSAYKRLRTVQSTGYHGNGQIVPYTPTYYPSPNPHMQVSQMQLYPTLPPVPPPTQLPPPPPPVAPVSNQIQSTSIMGGSHSQIGTRHFQGGRPS